MTDFDFSNCNILVIDDEPMFRDILVEILHEVGVNTIFEADNGQAGLDTIAAAGRHADLIICDLTMPNMDGFEFVAKLRDHEDSNIASIPVLILTGHIEQENVEKAVELGIHGYLKKPILIDTLVQKMIRAQVAPPINAKRLAR